MITVLQNLSTLRTKSYKLNIYNKETCLWAGFFVGDYYY
jgi:hypothetical protein